MFVLGVALFERGEANAERSRSRIDAFSDQALAHVVLGRDVFGQFGNAEISIDGFERAGREAGFKLAMHLA